MPENKPITPAEFEAAMLDIAFKDKDFDRDPESNHIEADDLFCKTLDSLGYFRGVEIFKNLPKWYS